MDKKRLQSHTHMPRILVSTFVGLLAVAGLVYFFHGQIWDSALSLYGFLRDREEIKAWVDASKSEDSAQAYLQEWIYDLPDHQAYVDKVGVDRLERLVDGREQRE